MGIIEAIIAAVFAIAGLAVGIPWGRMRGRAQGEQEARDRANRETLERFQAGQDAKRDGAGTPDQRVRANDDHW